MSRISAFLVILFVFFEFRTAQGKEKGPLEDYHHRGCSFVDSLKETLSLLVLSEFDFKNYYFGKDDDSREFIYLRLNLFAFRTDTDNRQAIAIFDVAYLKNKTIYGVSFFVCLEECKMHEKDKMFEFVLNAARPPIFIRSSECELQASKFAEGTDWVKHTESTNQNRVSRKPKFFKYFKRGAKRVAGIAVLGATVLAIAFVPPLGLSILAVELAIVYCVAKANGNLIGHGYIKFARIPISEKVEDGKETPLDMTPAIAGNRNITPGSEETDSKAQSSEIKPLLPKGVERSEGHNRKSSDKKEGLTVSESKPPLNGTKDKNNFPNVVSPSAHMGANGGDGVTNTAKVVGNDAQNPNFQSGLAQKNERVEDQHSKNPIARGEKVISQTNPLLNHKDENPENKKRQVVHNSENSKFEYQKYEPSGERKYKYEVVCFASTDYAGPLSTLPKNGLKGSEANSEVL